MSTENAFAAEADASDVAAAVSRDGYAVVRDAIDADTLDVGAAEMPEGSVLIYVGNVIHGGGSNRSDHARTGVVLHYSLGWLRQEENQYLAVPQEQARTLPDVLQELMGYSLGSSNLGFVDHVAPKDYLHGVRDPSESDLSPAGMSERVDALERFHVSHTARGPARYYDVDTD